MLCWFDQKVRDAAWGESYFAPKDMQTESKRLEILRKSLETHYGSRILDLFDQAWRSDSQRDCPTFAEWSVAIPDKVTSPEKDKVERIKKKPEDKDTQALYDRAQELEKQKEYGEALQLYREVIITAPSKLSREIEKRIANIESHLNELQVKPEPSKEEEIHPERSCPECGKTILVGQEICPHCEGKPKVTQKTPSAKEKTGAGKILAWTIPSLIIISGLALVILGLGGRGPLSSLRNETVVPVVTEEIQSPTETTIPTVINQETTTPSAEFGIGSTKISEVDGMVQMYIPAGEFSMGSEVRDNNESPVHEVYLDAFWMDEHEVTVQQFQLFIEDTGYETNPCGESDQHPASCVNWNDAKVYCDWAGRRLPTEAEWEKAAKGGQENTIYPWGDQDPICQTGVPNGARFDDDSQCNDIGSVEVMSYFPNGYGLYDMLGNVEEWVMDWYSEYYYSNSPYRNPQGPSSGWGRVRRGGSWMTRVSITSRLGYDPNGLGVDPARSGGTYGFRCAEDVLNEDGDFSDTANENYDHSSGTEIIDSDNLSHAQVTNQFSVNGIIQNMEWSPDGNYLAVSALINDKTDVNTKGRVILIEKDNWNGSHLEFDEVVGTVDELAWDPKGNIIAGSGDDMVHVWDSKSGCVSSPNAVRDFALIVGTVR